MRNPMCVMEVHQASKYIFRNKFHELYGQLVANMST